MVIYKERYDKILNMDWKVIKLIVGILIIFYGNWNNFFVFKIVF